MALGQEGGEVVRVGRGTALELAEEGSELGGDAPEAGVEEVRLGCL